MSISTALFSLLGSIALPFLRWYLTSRLVAPTLSLHQETALNIVKVCIVCAGVQGAMRTDRPPAARQRKRAGAFAPAPIS